MSLYVLVDNVYNDEYVNDFSEALIYDFPEAKDKYLDRWRLSPRFSISEEYESSKELWMIKSSPKKIKFDAQMYQDLLLLRLDIFNNIINLIGDDVEYKKINFINKKKENLAIYDYYAIRCKYEINILDDNKSDLKQNKFGEIFEINKFFIDKTKKTYSIFLEENILNPVNMIINQKIKDKLEKLSIKNLKFFPLENLDVNYLNKF